MRARFAPVASLAVALPFLVGGCELFFDIKETPDTPDASATEPFCATHLATLVCADFDEGTVADGWTSQNVVGTRLALGLDASVYVSPPRSLRVTSAAAQLTSCEAARLVKTFPATVTSLHVELDLRPCDAAFTTTGAREQLIDVNCVPHAPDGSATQQYAILNFGMRSGGQDGLDLSGADASGIGHQTADVRFAPPPASVFTHVVLDLQIGTTGSADLTIGDRYVVQETNVNTSCPGSSNRAFALGLFSCTETAACTVDYDNIVVDAAP